MKQYPTIEKYNLEHLGKSVFCFDKIDGSNFRVEWDRKYLKKNKDTYGFKKFGTKTMLINETSLFAEILDLFARKYADSLNKIFTDDKNFKNTEKFTVFGEYYGENSFAGTHKNEPHDVTIFDIFVYKKNFLAPSEFIKHFSHLGIPELKYNGLLTMEYLESVMYGNGEGVVYKGLDNNKIFMGKVKTFKWLNKVKELYGEKKMQEY